MRQGIGVFRKILPQISPETESSLRIMFHTAKVLLREAQVFIWMEVQISLLRKTFRTTMFMVLP